MAIRRNWPVTRHFTHNLVFYRGPSVLTGEPIIGVAGSSTSNRKTGPVVQIWILRADISPITAVQNGGDAAICGQCAHRGDGAGRARSCYVEYYRAPFNLWRGLPHTQRDVTPEELAELVCGKHLRLGAYGDPAAIPFDVWETILRNVPAWTAYTHQWRTCDQRFRRIAMASVDSAREKQEAAALGWRTFRVRIENDQLTPDEIMCPASDEGGHAAQCAQCKLCCGTSRSAKSIAIIAHSTRAIHFMRAQNSTGTPRIP